MPFKKEKKKFLTKKRHYIQQCKKMMMLIIWFVYPAVAHTKLRTFSSILSVSLILNRMLGNGGSTGIDEKNPSQTHRSSPLRPRQPFALLLLRSPLSSRSASSGFINPNLQFHAFIYKLRLYFHISIDQRSIIFKLASAFTLIWISLFM